jgi:hypothetical protein
MYRLAVCCNGDPNEHLLFHMCPEDVINKIWQEGEGHDTRLSQWAEVGKGAYFSEHLMCGPALPSLYFCIFVTSGHVWLRVQVQTVAVAP